MQRLHVFFPLLLLIHIIGLSAFAQPAPTLTEIKGHKLLDLGSITLDERGAETMEAEKKWAETTRRSLVARWKELVRSDKTHEAELSQTELEMNAIENYVDRIEQLFGHRFDIFRFRLFVMAAVIAFLGAFAMGYFYIAMRSDTLRETFSGDAGLQFAALFTIIITILVFGVLSVLEGKELSALLGGLSGYILGRGSGAQRPADERKGQD